MAARADSTGAPAMPLAPISSNNMLLFPASGPVRAKTRSGGTTPAKASEAPPAASPESAVALTKKGEAYATRNAPTWRGRPIPLTRAAIEAEIDRLIELIDVADGDVDLEDGGDPEPSLGGAELHGEVDLELDDCDNEPSLGWGRWHERQNQTMIATEIVFDADLEDEHDGREPDDESDGLEWGEGDPAEHDSGELIVGGGS